MARKRSDPFEAEGGPKLTDCFFAPRCARPARLRTDRHTKPGDFQALCHQCDERLHAERAERWCAERGLLTTGEREAYCKRMARTIGGAALDFEGWSKLITQRTVEVMLGTWTRDDERVLKRWQDMGILDERFMVVTATAPAAGREPGQD